MSSDLKFTSAGDYGMSYKIEAASKEEWAERAINAEKKLAVLLDEYGLDYQMTNAELIELLQDAANGEHDMTPHGADILQAIDRIEQYDVAVKELFSLLDATEETDEGRVHRPVQIVCVRTDMLIKLENVLATLKSTMEDRG